MMKKNNGMKWRSFLFQPPYRTLVVCAAVLLILFGGYAVWTPGKVVRDGRYDLRKNGMWLQHGWLGDDAWFQRNQKRPELFRNDVQILSLKQTLLTYHISDVYPHLAPCQPDGNIAAIDQEQMRRFLALMQGVRIMPWIGGVLDVHVFLDNQAWQKSFVSSVHDLLTTYPSLDGIHLNIEPLPSGFSAYSDLLRDLKANMPKGKILSIAAYPPPTVYQRSTDVHWNQAYYQEIAGIVDQLVVMMYDTSLKSQKLYQHLLKKWAQETLDWSGNTSVLFGLPAYEDAGVQYHYPDVENLKNGLLGICAGLAEYTDLPENYEGIAIYSEWEMQPEEWKRLQTYFLKQD